MDDPLVKAAPWIFIFVAVALLFLRVRLGVLRSKREERLGNERVPLGVYEHYKGKKYEVLCIAYDTETKNELVIYQTMYEPFGVWARSSKMFLEEVERDGVKMARFRYLGAQKNPLT